MYPMRLLAPNQAGIQTISLNLDVGQKHIIQQHMEKNVRELWYAIRALHKRNIRGQRELAKMKWIAFRQGGKMTLSEYISKFNSLHTDLLLTGVPFDGEAQLLQFQAGLDPKRFSLEALGALQQVIKLCSQVQTAARGRTPGLETRPPSPPGAPTKDILNGSVIRKRTEFLRRSR